MTAANWGGGVTFVPNHSLAESVLGADAPAREDSARDRMTGPRVSHQRGGLVAAHGCFIEQVPATHHCEQQSLLALHATPRSRH